MTQSLEPNPQPSHALPASGSLQFNREAEIAEITQRMKRGANNFYWIAALSVINSILSLTGSSTYFVIGLAATLIVDGLTVGLSQSLSENSIIVKIIGLVLSILISAVFGLFGYFAGQGKRWVFLVGMILYALDGLIMLAFADWIGVLFHAFFLWGLFGGLRALGELQKKSSQPQTAFPQDIGVQ
jgi:hypothetical protein